MPPTKAKTYGQYKYACAGAKQPSNGAVKNNYLAPSRCPPNATAALIFRSLTKKHKECSALGRYEHNMVIIGPTLWPFLRANPRRQRYARSCRNTPPRKMFEPRTFNQRKLRQVGSRANPTNPIFCSLENLKVGFWIGKRNTIRKQTHVHKRIATLTGMHALLFR